MQSRRTTAARVALVALLVFHAAAGELERTEIREAESRGAVCNDFSHAIYYLDKSTTSNKWVIFFEGGGGCSSFTSCNKRWIEGNGRNQALMSSSRIRFPQTVTGEDILSNDRSNNPQFHDYSHVLVPYCSSDAWLANRSHPRFNNHEEFRFNETENADNFVFKGRVIFQSVIQDLLAIPGGLGTAKEIVLAGSSAGGVGVLNNIAWVQEQINSNVKILVLIDSSWFVPFNGHHPISWTNEQANLLGITQDACLDVSLGFPCCTSPACLLRKGYLSPNNTPPVFAVSSMYDIFTLEAALVDLIGQIPENDDQSLLRLFNSYGAVVQQSYQQALLLSSSLSLFTPSCSQHVYFATSSLWGPGAILNRTARGLYKEGVFELSNPVKSGNWDRVQVFSTSAQATTLHQAIRTWYTHQNESFFFSDDCNGPVCGTCPSEVRLSPEKDVWPKGVNILILLFSVLMTAVPVCLKLFAYFHMKYMLYRQRVYAYSVQKAFQRRPQFPKAVHAVNVSCTELYYRVETVNRSKSKEEDESHLVSPNSPKELKLKAKVETFVPICRRCMHGSTDSVSEEEHFTSSRGANGRPDSGISSIGRSSPHFQTEDTKSTATILSSASSESDRNSVSPSHSSTPTPHRNIKRKTILRRVNLYINPGELMAVMGPSGSGKTTLLDVLLGRRTAGSTQGDIYINGTPLSKTRNWFVLNTGYVRQLATSFYNELTVRENLLFSMNLQAPRGMSLEHKLERVEQVIKETGLQEQADLKVGDGLGLGLSGGQRKRLAIAVQLLSLPSIIFLDEPTSGLDSASSLEILKRLQVLAETGRAIVVTIHQPRSEIFMAFDKILLLCNGQVAFFGSPVRVWNFFMRALDVSEAELRERVGQVTNHADAILDFLKESDSQRKVLQAYEGSGEPKRVKMAVLNAKEDKDASSASPHTHSSRHPGFWHRLVSLESRASLRQNIFSILYLPIVYLVFGAILSTVYLLTEEAIQIMSVTCLLSCSSSLFMSSIVMSLLIEPLKLFQLEHSDGISSAHELILQVFIRMSSICTFPLAVCATMVFGLVYQNYTIDVYLEVLLAFLLVNQAWIALFILLTVSYPQQAHRLCPIFASIGGFCCGFIVPRPLMPPYYRWIFYINPSYYAYAATTVTALEGNDALGCERESPLECFRESGIAVLERFGLEDVNPVSNLVVLMAMVIILVTLGFVVLQLKVNLPYIHEKLFGCFCVIAQWKRKERVLSAPSSPVPWIKLKNTSTVDPPTGMNVHLKTFTEETDSDVRFNVSSEFLEHGEHQLFYNLPWERPMDFDTVDGAIYSLKSPTVDRTSIINGLPSPKVVTFSGVTDIDEPASPHSEIIDMEEERNEEERQRVADLKWNQRREKMESELHRLKHYYRSVSMAKRHHSIGDCSFSDLDLDDDDCDTRRRVRGRAFVPINRSHSVPPDSNRPPTLEGIPSLDVHDEDEGNQIMGLPPKDIPTMEESSDCAGGIEGLDVFEIPGEEVDMGDCWDTHSESDGDASS